MKVCYWRARCYSAHARIPVYEGGEKLSVVSESIMCSHAFACQLDGTYNCLFLSFLTRGQSLEHGVNERMIVYAHNYVGYSNQVLRFLNTLFQSHTIKFHPVTALRTFSFKKFKFNYAINDYQNFKRQGHQKNCM